MPRNRNAEISKAVGAGLLAAGCWFIDPAASLIVVGLIFLADGMRGSMR